jgi:hypothetical protein
VGDVFALVYGCHGFLTTSTLRGAPGSMGVALSSSLACIQVRSRSDVTGRLYVLNHAVCGGEASQPKQARAVPTKPRRGVPRQGRERHWVEFPIRSDFLCLPAARSSCLLSLDTHLTRVVKCGAAPWSSAPQRMCGSDVNCPRHM